MLGDGEIDDLTLEVVARLRVQPVVALFARARATTRPVRRRWPGCGPCHHVGAQRPASRIELLRVVPQAEEHLLDDLLGQRAIVQDAHREPEGGVAVAAVGLGERLLAEPGDGHHQRGIARVPQVGVHHIQEYGAMGAGG